jgi:starch synthase (maltosyl-transferring)
MLRTSDRSDDRPRAVLHVVNQLTVGGTERQMFVVVDGLQRRGWRPYVAYLNAAAGELLAPLRALGAAPFELPLGGSLLRPNSLVQAARLAAHARRLGVRLLHAHDPYSNVLAVLAARLAALPVIVSRRDRGDWRCARERLLVGFANSSADVILANAPGLARGRRVRVIPNGLDLDAFDAQAAGEPDPPLPPAPPGGYRVALVGNMDRPHKGHAELIEAAARLADRWPIQWLLPSDGALRGQLEARARAFGVADRVCFLGRRRDVPRLLARVDLVVHPSWSEGLPNAILEAMAARRAVVASAIPGCRELCEDGVTGLLVPPRDAAALTAAVARLLPDEATRRRLGEQGRCRVEERFGLGPALEALIRLYQQL